MITEVITIFSGATLTVASLGLGVIVYIFSGLIFTNKESDTQSKLVAGAAITTNVILLGTGVYLTYEGVNDLL